jgi:large subunit ribosomal protein L24
MKIKKGDKVQIISGKEKGKTGTVKLTLPADKKVVVENINTVKRHVKPGVLSKEGGIVTFEKPLDVSKVMIYCEKCGRPTRVGYRIINDKKFRVCTKCEEVLDK